MDSRTRKVTMIGMLCAISYVVMVVGRIPVVMFLKYDPKDVIITIGGYLFGPMASFMISGVVSVAEMITVSGTGPIGCVMNILSSCCFACTAAYVYKKRHNMSGAVIGLVIACLLTTAVMLLWNYLVTPIYMGLDREIVKGYLLPMFLPFNLLKGGLNMAIVLLIYKPIVRMLRKANLLESSKSALQPPQAKPVAVWLVAGLLLATCVLIILAWRGII